jgi:hypothetical protein
MLFGVWVLVGGGELSEARSVQPIAIYLVDDHPLQLAVAGPPFRWLQVESLDTELNGLIGRYEPDQVTILIDRIPAGPAWEQLLGALLNERVRMVITHLAPLSPAQRQQLIGLCAQVGAQLITPGDAGRNRTAAPD